MQFDQSVSYSLEKRLLVFLAGRMPRYVTSNHMTVLGLAGALLAFGGYFESGSNVRFLWLADLGIVLNWFGDSLDGTIARVRRQERDSYGFFVDRSVDLLSQLLMGIGLGLTPYVRFDIACLSLIAYLALMAYMLIRERTFGTMPISVVGIGPTEVRASMVLLNTWMMFGHPSARELFHFRFTSIDVGVGIFAAGVFVILPILVLVDERRAARVHQTSMHLRGATRGEQLSRAR